MPPFYGQYSLQPTRTDLRFNADALFPDLNNIPEFPAPFSMNPDNRTAYTYAVERQRAAHLRHRSYLFEVAYTGSHSYNEHKRFNINQAQPGTTPIVTRVPYPAFQSAILYSSDGGWAVVQRADVPPRQALLRRAVLPRQLPAVEEPGQRLRRNRSERHGATRGI